MQRGKLDSRDLTSLGTGKQEVRILAIAGRRGGAWPIAFRAVGRFSVASDSGNCGASASTLSAAARLLPEVRLSPPCLATKGDAVALFHKSAADVIAHKPTSQRPSLGLRKLAAVVDCSGNAG
jgi:hypothetical protein